MGRGRRAVLATLAVVVAVLVLTVLAWRAGLFWGGREPVPAITGRPVERIAITGDIGTRDEKVRATVDEMVDQSSSSASYGRPS